MDTLNYKVPMTEQEVADWNKNHPDRLAVRVVGGSSPEAQKERRVKKALTAKENAELALKFKALLATNPGLADQA